MPLFQGLPDFRALGGNTPNLVQRASRAVQHLSHSPLQKLWSVGSYESWVVEGRFTSTAKLHSRMTSNISECKTTPSGCGCNVMLFYLLIRAHERSSRKLNIKFKKRERARQKKKQPHVRARVYSFKSGFQLSGRGLFGRLIPANLLNISAILRKYTSRFLRFMFSRHILSSRSLRSLIIH